MTTNAAAPERNRHHTRTQYDYTDEELWREQQRDRAEAEYFATHDTTPLTHNYPLASVSSILVGNGANNWNESVPF